MPTYRFTLKPGQTLPQYVAGRFLQYVEGEGEIQFRRDGADWETFVVGTGTGDRDFRFFEIRNPQSVDVTFSVWAGGERFITDRRNQIEAATDFLPVGDVATKYVGGVLLAGQDLDLSGVPPSGYVRRKAVQISNTDPAVTVYLCDAAGAVGGIVRAGETIAPPVSGFLRIRNTAGAGVPLAVGEYWWKP